MQNTLELVTGVCNTVDEGLDQLATAGRHILELVSPDNIALFSQGTHPFAFGLDERISSGPRYHKLLDKSQYWAYQMLIFVVIMYVCLAHGCQSLTSTITRS